MKYTITFSDFSDLFSKSDTYKDNFSYEGLRALFDYLEGYEEETGEQLDFDPIALCCEYTEYGSLEDVQAEYTDIKSMEDLQEHTQVIECDNGHIIIQNF
jgi:hypothetical protein